MKQYLIAISSVTFLLFFSSTAHAYVGPGLGLGVIGVIAGIFMAIVLGVAGLFWYPLKRVLGKGKQANAKAADTDTDTDKQEDSDTAAVSVNTAAAAKEPKEPELPAS